MGAPTFKEQIAADISTTFLNCLEFADTHTVNGKKMAEPVLLRSTFPFSTLR